MLGLLTTYRLALEGLVLALLLAAVGTQTWRLHTEQTGRALEKSVFDAQFARAAIAQADAERDARAEESRRAAAQKEALDAADQKLQQARADAALADAATGRLQQRVAGLVADARRAAQNPGAVASGPPADDALGLLAELQGRLDEAAGRFAEIADQRGAAGQLCEQLYDSLTPATPSDYTLRVRLGASPR